MKAKICGITNLQDALFSLHCGAWALGFIFYSASPRYIDKDKAKQLIANLPTSILKVGIFIEENEQQIAHTMEEIGLDLAQVYQDKHFSLSLKQKMILSLQPNVISDLPENKILEQYAYILLDAPRVDEQYGGTGQQAHWDIASTLAKRHRLILAGGLYPNNVQTAIKTVRPFAVDVASGTEQLPGKKNPYLVKQFLQMVQHENSNT